ncbi:MAG TPA: hypothetical protein VF159_10790 [Gemmatimonadaceae bacterium]
MRLVADVLDKQLIDVTGRNAGKADGVVLEIDDGQPPRIAYIEVGPITLLRRFSTRLARWYARLDARFGDGRGQPIRIPWTRVKGQGITLTLDFAADSSPIFAFERWMRDRIICRIPGAARRGQSTR